MSTIDFDAAHCRIDMEDHQSAVPDSAEPSQEATVIDADEFGAVADQLLYARRTSWALSILAVLGVMYTIYAGRSLLLPVTLAGVLALLFQPLVRRLKKWGIPSFLGAAILLATAGGGLLLGAVHLVGPAAEWLDRVPIGLRLREMEDKLEPIREPLAELSMATKKIQDFAMSPSGSAAPTEKVEIQQPSLTTTVVSTTGEFAAGAAICLIVLYFFLVLGDTLLNSVVQLMPRLKQKKETVALVRNVEEGVSCYLLTVTAINVGLGIVVAFVMWLIGMPNPTLWGAMATFLNFIPYAGAFVGTCVVFLVGLFTFNSIGEAAIAPLAYFALTSIEGNFVTPTVLGCRMSLNPIVVFLWLAFWGWMWGIGGALLAVPLLAIFKIGCDQFETTKPLSLLVSR